MGKSTGIMEEVWGSMKVSPIIWEKSFSACRSGRGEETSAFFSFSKNSRTLDQIKQRKKLETSFGISSLVATFISGLRALCVTVGLFVALHSNLFLFLDFCWDLLDS